MNWLTAIKTRYEGKAISHRPDLEGRVHLWTNKRDDIPAVQLNDYTDYAKVHATHVWLRKGIKVLADNFSVLPVHVTDDKGKPIDAHPLTELLAFGNDQHSAADLWAAWVPSMILGGEAFVEIVGDSRARPVELWARRPDYIAIVPDKTRPLYPAAAGYRWDLDDGAIDYEPDEMIMWRFNNPLSIWRGLSLIGAVRAGLTIDIFAQAWSKKLLKEGGVPDIGVITPQGITVPEQEKLERQFAEKYQGWENWHKAIFMEEGIIDIKPLSFPPKDMQWLEQRKVARDEIAAMLGIPDMLMGFGADTYDTEEKRTSALRSLWTLTLVPLVQFRDAQLNTFFTKRRPLLTPGQRIETDLSGVGVLQEDITPKVETAKSLWSMGYPVNLIDERLGLGMGPIEGGDVGYRPIALIEMGKDNPPPAPMPDFTPRDDSADEEDEDEEKAVVAWLPAASPWKAPEYDSMEHRAYILRQDTLTRPFEERMARALKRYFQRQQNEVGKKLRERAKGKTTKQTLPPVEDIFDVETEEKLFEEEMRPFVLALFVEAGTTALDLVLGADAPEFQIDNIAVKQAIEYILDQHSQKTNDTTFRGLTALFQEAEDEGASIPRISEMLNEYFKGRKSAYQTERIARTTMIASHNAASLQGYAQSGVVYGHEWLAALDNRVRPSHRAAHGQFKPLGGRFEVGGSLLRHPGDPAAPAEEIVNCRCSTYPVTRMPSA